MRGMEGGGLAHQGPLLTVSPWDITGAQASLSLILCHPKQEIKIFVVIVASWSPDDLHSSTFKVGGRVSKGIFCCSCLFSIAV